MAAMRLCQPGSRLLHYLQMSGGEELGHQMLTRVGLLLLGPRLTSARFITSHCVSIAKKMVCGLNGCVFPRHEGLFVLCDGVVGPAGSFSSRMVCSLAQDGNGR